MRGSLSCVLLIHIIFIIIIVLQSFLYVLFFFDNGKINLTYLVSDYNRVNKQLLAIPLLSLRSIFLLFKFQHINHS